jgi:hypothetical protein
MKAIKAISYIIQANYREPWLNWTQIKNAKIGDQPVWLTFWNAFKVRYIFIIKLNKYFFLDKLCILIFVSYICRRDALG